MIGAASPTVVNAIQCYTLHGKESSKRGDRGREWQSVAWMNKPWAAAAALNKLLGAGDRFREHLCVIG